MSAPDRASALYADEGPQKLAQAAAVIDDLLAAQRDLIQQRDSNAKLAAAYAEAVKMAQVGEIDVLDIQDVAQRLAAPERMKSASWTPSEQQSPGDVVAYSAASPTALDPLTAMLRSSSLRPAHLR